MGREIRKTRYLSEIGSVAELREARRELELREWFARERLMDDIHSTLSLDTLLSIVAPRGSLLDKVIGSVGTGFTAVQGIIGAISSMLSDRAARKRTPARPVCNTASEHSASGHAASVHTAKKSVAAPPVPRKRSPKAKTGIEVEVEIEPKKVPATRRKKTVKT